MSACSDAKNWAVPRSDCEAIWPRRIVDLEKLDEGRGGQADDACNRRRHVPSPRPRPRPHALDVGREDEAAAAAAHSLIRRATEGSSEPLADLHVGARE